ncbi:MAG: DUF177 domain-containing protein [Peptococcaceae bacterium]|nr:DUF177 domain-containing protein [Peptococcaceae bacterium]MDH7525473.1 DUF177 domain-containing protein [Peptococcaceae bacterium]
MKLNVSRLRKEPGSREEFGCVIASFRDEGDIVICSPIQVEGCVVNTGKLLEMKAKVKTAFLTSCSRCLEEVRLPVDFEFTEHYCHESDCDQEMINSADKNDITVFNEEWIDITQAVQQNLILNMPMRVLCSPGCPGICPHCGKNLKEGKCECREGDIDPRMAVLAKLIKDQANN